MAWGVDNLQPDLAELQGFPILEIQCLKLCLCHNAQAYLGACAAPELQVTGNKVGVEVSQENVLDCQAQVLGVFDVIIDVPPRAHNHGCRRFLVANHEGSVGQATQVILLKNHSCSPVPKGELLPQSRFSQGFSEAASKLG